MNAFKISVLLYRRIIGRPCGQVVGYFVLSNSSISQVILEYSKWVLILIAAWQAIEAAIFSFIRSKLTFWVSLSNPSNSSPKSFFRSAVVRSAGTDLMAKVRWPKGSTSNPQEFNFDHFFNLKEMLCFQAGYYGVEKSIFKFSKAYGFSKATMLKNSTDDIYPLFSISKRNPSAQITGP